MLESRLFHTHQGVCVYCNRFIEVTSAYNKLYIYKVSIWSVLMCIHLWSDHYNQEKEHCHPSLQSFLMGPCNLFLPASPFKELRDLFSVSKNELAFSSTLYKWNHTICGLSWLAPFMMFSRLMSLQVAGIYMAACTRITFCLFCGLTVRFAGSQFSDRDWSPATAVKARNLNH